MRNANYNPRDWSSQPPAFKDDYKSTSLRSHQQPLIPLAQALGEVTGPVFGHEDVDDSDADMTRNGVVNGEPLGERMIVAGRVVDEGNKPIPNTLIELWQANAAGRYIHKGDQHSAPLDPNFFGGGRCVTDENGNYRFLTIKPGAYPWGNHDNGWRPAHIHFSLFGPAFVTRLVTQMYFPGDPLLDYDPIFQATADAAARASLVAQFSLDITEPDYALGYQFDIVLRGANATPFED
jgi:protocatechuate 3,4-dioxygenase, beta subunit